jgi:dTDP-4-amino-4,6-dideoxygalactose transaminase
VPPVRFQSPQLPPTDRIEAYLAHSRAARWFSNDGPCARELRARLAAYVGRGTQVVLTANATLGLMVALRAVVDRVQRPGSAVVVPSFTFIATLNALHWCGLTPLFVDVGDADWHLDPDALERALEKYGDGVAAVLACSTFGAAPTAAVAGAWSDACAAHGVPLIVDSAPGFGAVADDGARLGARGDAEVFSFHATKPFAIGEGGAVTTRDADLAERIGRLVNFGFDAERRVDGRAGLNAKMSEIHAAIGLAVLDGFDDVLEARRTRAAVIRAALEPEGFAFQVGATSSTWQFVPVLAPDPVTRDKVLAAAPRYDVEIRHYHEALHRSPAFAGAATSGTLTTTERLGRHALSLPLANDLEPMELQRIVDAVLTP